MGGVSVVFVEAMQTKNCSFMISHHISLFPVTLRWIMTQSQKLSAQTQGLGFSNKLAVLSANPPHHADQNWQHYGLCQTDCTQHQQIKLQPWKACGRITDPDSLMKKRESRAE